MVIGAVALASSFAGCSAADSTQDDSDDEQTAQDYEPIYGGVVDETDDAVVFLLSSDNLACTGTIVAKDGDTGYVLTAGHCAGMATIVQADDLSCVETGTCDNVWFVDEQVVHPSFDLNRIDAGYDFSLIRFSGATTAPDPIPAASGADGVEAHTQVDIVGYGVTEQQQDNLLRMHVVMPISELYGNYLGFDQSGGQGTCSGDSGGPTILDGKVVGVTSFGDEQCNQFGYAGRVACVYNDFIAPYIGAQPESGGPKCPSAGGAGGGAASSGGGGGGSDAGGGGGADGDGPDSGCGCATVGASGAPGAAWLAALGAAFAIGIAARRRRREPRGLELRAAKIS